MGQLRVTEKALPSHNRRHNRSLVLQRLFHDGEMSRADLARISGLTAVTISDLVGELHSEGLLLDLGPRVDARVGKPALVIAFDHGARSIVGLDLSTEAECTGALVSLRGEVREHRRLARDGASGADAVELALGLAAELIASSTAPVLGIGIGSPGVVDHGGVVREAPNLGWRGLDLRRVFAERFGLPVHVANDANTAALAVHTFHRGGGANLLLVLLGDGVGAGLIIGGSLVEGDQFTGGEIGHVVIDEDGEQCSCGRRGCLESAVSVAHLGPRLAAASAPEQERLLRRAGRSLGIALAPIVAVLGIDAVVLAGPERFVEGALLEEARATIARRTLPAVTRELRMESRTDPGELVLQGAAALVLSHELGIS
jgi:predicted NBD/HSP70 family sugar kinase